MKENRLQPGSIQTGMVIYWTLDNIGALEMESKIYKFLKSMAIGERYVRSSIDPNRNFEVTIHSPEVER